MQQRRVTLLESIIAISIGDVETTYTIIEGETGSISLGFLSGLKTDQISSITGKSLIYEYESTTDLETTNTAGATVIDTGVIGKITYHDFFENLSKLLDCNWGMDGGGVFFFKRRDIIKKDANDITENTIKVFVDGFFDGEAMVSRDTDRLFNVVIAVGKDENGDDVPSTPVQDADSISRYGRKEAVLELPNVKSPELLKAAAEFYLAESKDPYFTVSLKTFMNSIDEVPFGVYRYTKQDVFYEGVLHKIKYSIDENKKSLTYEINEPSIKAEDYFSILVSNRR